MCLLENLRKCNNSLRDFLILAYLLSQYSKQYKEEIAIHYHALKEIPNFQDLPEDDFVASFIGAGRKTDTLKG